MELCERSGRLKAFGDGEDFRGFGALPSPLPRVTEHQLDLIPFAMRCEENPLDGGETAALANSNQECRFELGSSRWSEGTGWMEPDVTMVHAEHAALEILFGQRAGHWQRLIPEAKRVAGILLPEIRLGC
jgi:hypothetical protein